MKYYQAHRYGFWDWMDNQMNPKADAITILVALLIIFVLAFLKLGMVG